MLSTRISLNKTALKRDDAHSALVNLICNAHDLSKHTNLPQSLNVIQIEESDETNVVGLSRDAADKWGIENAKNRPKQNANKS